MLIYNIKTQVEFDLGYNPLIFDGVMGLFIKNSTFSGGHPCPMDTFLVFKHIVIIINYCTLFKPGPVF